MAIARIPVNIDGEHTEVLSLAYDIVGDTGPNWVLTPGGRFSKDRPGVRELATALADLGNRVLLWDRPNTGESEVCFTGVTESGMQADALAALLSHLEMTPTIIFGGSGGARVSLLTAVRHPATARALAVWMVSGGAYGLLTIGIGYCNASIEAVFNGTMEDVVNIPEQTQGNWQEPMRRNPESRPKILAQDRLTFRETMQRWLKAYCPCEDLVPGVTNADIRQLGCPAIVFRSGLKDMYHLRETSEQLAALLPHSEMAELPWEDSPRIDSSVWPQNWPLLAPIVHEWAAKQFS
jgi:pimeloyl-ACP methyl ester carboxylesterase